MRWVYYSNIGPRENFFQKLTQIDLKLWYQISDPLSKLSNLEFGNQFWGLCIFPHKSGLFVDFIPLFYEEKVTWIKSCTISWVYTVRKVKRSIYSILWGILGVQRWYNLGQKRSSCVPKKHVCECCPKTFRGRVVTFFGEYTFFMRSIIGDFAL